MHTSALLGPLLALSASAIVSPDGTGRVPAMGWNSWNEYGCDIHESVFTEVGELLVSLGLKDLGYQYVNIDDCWSNKELRRDNSTSRIIVDTVKFPNGISGVADKVHDLGLQLGIYSDAGLSTCGGFAGSLGYEEIDAETFAEWGVDYLKYDNCNVPEEWTDEYAYDPALPDDPARPDDYDFGDSLTAVRYNAMRDALLKQDRIIEYSLCAWGHARVESWGNETGHSWRMWGDIYPEWAGKYDYSWGLMPIVNQAALHWRDTGLWGHNDWDMLEVGNGNLTFEENRSHFALWAAFKSPLIIGTPLSGIKDEILGILSNKELIDFSQDATYPDSVRPFNLKMPVALTTENTTHPPSHYVGTSTKGIHVFLLNPESKKKKLEFKFKDTPGLKNAKGRKFLVHDMWTGKDIGVFKNKFSIDVKKHDTAALRVTAVNGKHPNPRWTPTKDRRDY